jgi:hypothetical protein
VRNRTSPELSAGNRIAPDVCGRAGQHGRRRCAVCSGEALVRKPYRRFSWLDILPLYLVQAAVIYSFSVRGLDVLAAFGFEPSAQRWLIGVATVPVAIFFAILFCPVNDFSVALSRRFGSALFGRSREASRYMNPGLRSSLFRH